jgi:hypothetical protein
MNVVTHLRPALPLAALKSKRIFLRRADVRVDNSRNPKTSSCGGTSITVLGRLAPETQPFIRE